MIEFDVETTGLQWYADDLFLVQFLMPGATEAVVLEHPGESEEIQAFLNHGDGYRAWNSKFDLHFLRKAGYRLPDPALWHDGMVVAHLLDERHSVALQAVGDRMFGDEPWPVGAGAELETALRSWLTTETTRRRKESKASGIEFIRPNYSHVPMEIMAPYARHDVELQRRICDELEPKLTPKLRTLYELEMRVMVALFEMECHGLQIDTTSLPALERELEDTLERQSSKAGELANVDNEEEFEFNPKSTPQVANALKARGADLSHVRKLKSGLPSTDTEALESIDDPLARTILDFRGTETMYTSFVNPMLHTTWSSRTKTWRKPFVQDGVLHANFRQVGTRTGRMSSSDPNVQNWHRDDLRLRHLVTAREGYKLVAADLDSIELKLFAAFLGEGILLEYMSDPTSDMHTYTAEMLGLKDFDRGEGHIESARQRGKKYNYLTLYGGGQRAMMKWFRVDQKKAKAMERAYHEAFPEVEPFQEDIEITLEDFGYVESPWGRKHRPYDRQHTEREAYKFVNYLIQGTAGDLIKEATARTHEEGLPIITVVHDEIVVEVPEAEAQSAADRLVQNLTDHPRITKIVPLGADAKIVDRWSYAKDEDFVPNYVKETAHA